MARYVSGHGFPWPFLLSHVKSEGWWLSKLDSHSKNSIASIPSR